MPSVSVLPTAPSVEAAWERYRALAEQVVENPRLLIDRDHMENLARAQRAWTDAFLVWDAA